MLSYDLATSIRRHGCYPPPPDRTRPEQPRPWSLRLDRLVMAHRALIVSRHPGWWSVVGSLIPELLTLEDELLRHTFPADVKDLPDGSVGQRWDLATSFRLWSR